MVEARPRQDPVDTFSFFFYLLNQIERIKIERQRLTNNMLATKKGGAVKKKDHARR